ncbi:MAG: DNRLRE domain-containing protein [Actinomycetota bacterium]
MAGAVPKPKKGGPNFDVFSVAGGEHLALVYPHDVNYKDVNGNWVPIPLFLTGDATSWTGTVGSTSVAFPRTLSAGSPVQFSIPQGSLHTHLVGLDPAGVKGTRNNVTVTYKDALAATDAVYRLTTTGYKEEIVLKGPSAAGSVSWDIQATGLTLELGEGNKILILAGTEEVGVIPAPVAYDSSPELKETSPLPVLVDLGGGRYRIDIEVEEAYLAQATYPVRIDPGEATKYPTRDAYVNQAFPGTSYESSQYLRVGSGKRTFVRFDTSGIQRDERIVYGAQLSLFMTAQGQGSTAVSIRRPEDSWPATLTWNTQPGVNTKDYGQASGPVNKWLNLDVGGIYQQYLDNSLGDKGVRLHSSDDKTFLADEFGGDGRPILFLTWNDLPASPNLDTPLAGAVFETESPTLKLSGMPWDPNGDDVLVQFQVSDDPTDFTGSHLQWTSPWTDEIRYTIPAGVLTDGQDYYWRAQSWDVCDKPDGMCPLNDATGTWHARNASGVRKFSVSYKHFGEDPKYAMWSQPLGNDMTLKVNESNGNLFLDLPLDVLSTPVDDLAIGLSYNHQQGADVGLGAGWDLAIGPASSGRQLPVHLSEIADEGVKIRFRDGSAAFFPERSNRVFTAGGAGSVKKNKDNGYTYVTPDGGVYTFGMNGRLHQAKPAATADGYAGQAFSYTFNATEQLTKVTDALGREVTLTWSQGRPSQIEAWDGLDGRTWTLNYGTRLTSITTPASETIGFTYAGGQITEVRDGQQTLDGAPGWTISYLTDPTGLSRVSTITAPGAPRSWTFEYPAAAADYRGRTAKWAKVTDPRGPLTPTITDDFQTLIDFNWAGLPLRIAGPADASGVWPVTTQAWDTNNNLLCKREPYANAIAEAGCDASDQTDQLNTEYAYDNQPPYRLTSVTQPAPTGSAQAPRATDTYQYDDNWNFRGLWAEQFNNASMAGIPAGEGLWTEFDRNWGDGSPPAITRVDNWTMRWTGYLEIDKTGDYEFRVYSNDGASLTVGTTTLTECIGSDNAYDDYNCGTSKDAKRKLWPGKRPITIEFQDRTGPARLTVKWDQGNGNWQVLPATVLSPNLGLVTKQVGPVASTTFGYPNDDAMARRLPASETVADLTGQAPNRKTTYAYDGYGRVVSTIDPLGKPSTNTYTGACLTKTVDRTGAEVRYECNAAGDVTKVTTVIRAVAPEPSQPEQPAQPYQERVTSTTYDAMGRVDTVSEGTATSLEVVSDTDYDLAGRVKTVKDKRGNTTTNVYDAQGRLWKEILPDPDGPGDAASPVTEHLYDDVGNETRRIDPRGFEWRTEHDALNRVVKTLDPLCVINGESHSSCSKSSTAYSLSARTVTVTDPSGVVTVTTFDVLGRKVSEKVATLPATTFEYDVVGNLIKQTDPAGVWVQKTYNGFGEALTEVTPLTATSPPATATATYHYDDGGRMDWVDGPRTDAVDKTTYGYDAEGRITSATLPLAQNATTTYRYSDAGERVRVIDGNGRVRSWTYDARGREETASDARGTTTHVYDDLSRLIETRLPTGVTQKFDYDNLGRRTRRYGIKSSQTVDDERFSYDVAGNITGAEKAGGGDPVVMAYDQAGRLSTTTATITFTEEVSQTTYTYTKDRITQRTDAAGTTTFNYNTKGQLTDLTDPFGGRSDYEYYADGRPKSRTTGDLVLTRTYNAAGRIQAQVATAGTELIDNIEVPIEVAYFSLSYDPAGNVTAKTARVEGWPASERGTWGYGYDGADRMSSATDPGGTTTTYGYDGAGNRTSVKVGAAAAVTTTYDSAGNPTSATDGTTYTTDPGRVADQGDEGLVGHHLRLRHLGPADGCRDALGHGDLRPRRPGQDRHPHQGLHHHVLRVLGHR